MVAQSTCPWELLVDGITSEYLPISEMILRREDTGEELLMEAVARIPGDVLSLISNHPKATPRVKAAVDERETLWRLGGVPA